MDLLLRQARPDEYEAVGSLTLRAYQHGEGMADPESDYTKELRDAERRAREAELLVVEEDAHPGELVATVTVCRPGTAWAEVAHDDELELRMLAVVPELRGQGIAHEVMTRLRETARAEGRVIVVSVVEENVAARALYEGLGFARDPARDWWPTDRVSLLVYRDRTS